MPRTQVYFHDMLSRKCLDLMLTQFLRRPMQFMYVSTKLAPIGNGCRGSTFSPVVNVPDFSKAAAHDRRIVEKLYKPKVRKQAC